MVAGDIIYAIFIHFPASRSLTLYPTELRAHLAWQLNDDNTETQENQGGWCFLFLTGFAEDWRKRNNRVQGTAPPQAPVS